MKSPSLPEYLVQYVNFLVDFLVDTKICCEPYQDKRIIEKDLLTYAFFSTVYSTPQKLDHLLNKI